VGAWRRVAAVKKPRKKSRRVRMAEAVRQDCDPVIFALGFRNPRKSDSDRWGETTRRNVYIRWRGTTYDEILLQWDKYNRPKFFLRYRTSQVEHPPQDGHAAVRLVTRGTMIVWRLPRTYVGSAWFGPWRSPGSVAAFVNRRVLRLNAFLLHGETEWYLNPGKPRREPRDGDEWVERRSWGDAWLDPESDYRPD
jgi:hypothetical protein